ncbi:MAG: C-type lectin domain family 4 er E-like isoform [Planctomycetaceae bacterium]|nr:C-type lectin domain family 4 er E-like isoform [Planctomycetaceae bacterium]
MSQNLLAVAVIFGSVAFTADLSEKWQKRLDSADGVYQAAKLKAQNAMYYALQKANSDRLKLLKTALADTTKSGDFDAATAIKERITAAEQEGTIRAKPKNVVQFGGHEYAIIQEPATWHVAKQICQEMGGHLAVINSTEENDRLKALCIESKVKVWLGATDEVTEGKWQWIDGSPVRIEIQTDNDNGDEHCMRFSPHIGTWDDVPSGQRYAFLCEWDN